MSSLALVEVIERLPSLYFESCASVVGPCVVIKTSSFFQLVLRPLVVPVTYRCAAFLLGAATPMPVTMDSL
jgi:hypothetical protein